jgi:hypothetical protein
VYGCGINFYLKKNDDYKRTTTTTHRQTNDVEKKKELGGIYFCKIDLSMCVNI